MKWLGKWGKTVLRIERRYFEEKMDWLRREILLCFDYRGPRSLDTLSLFNTGQYALRRDVEFERMRY